MRSKSREETPKEGMNRKTCSTQNLLCNAQMSTVSGLLKLIGMCKRLRTHKNVAFGQQLETGFAYFGRVFAAYRACRRRRDVAAIPSVWRRDEQAERRIRSGDRGRSAGRASHPRLDPGLQLFIQRQVAQPVRPCGGRGGRLDRHGDIGHRDCLSGVHGGGCMFFDHTVLRRFGKWVILHIQLVWPHRGG